MMRRQPLKTVDMRPPPVKSKRSLTSLPLFKAIDSALRAGFKQYRHMRSLQRHAANLKTAFDFHKAKDAGL